MGIYDRPHRFIAGTLPFWPGLKSATLCVCNKTSTDPIHLSYTHGSLDDDDRADAVVEDAYEHGFDRDNDR